jgi:hypothetical protein
MDERTDTDVLTLEQAEQAQRLDALISRIDGRQRLTGRVKQQITSHPLWFSAAALGVAALVAGVAAVLVHRARQRPLARLARAGDGFMAALRTVDHVASTVDRLVKKEPSPVGQVSTAAASTVAALVARRLSERLLQRLA